jgi:hypothetical protein
MIANMSGARRFGGALALLLLAGLAWWSWPVIRTGDDAAAPVVQLPPAPVADGAASRPSASDPIPGTSALPDPRIATTLQDPGAVFRNIRSVDASNQVVCGEVRRSDRPYYRRFVWVAEVQMLATDDGSPDFANVAKLCDGRASLRP